MACAVSDTEAAVVKLTKAGRKVLAEGGSTPGKKSTALLLGNEAAGARRSLAVDEDAKRVSIVQEAGMSFTVQELPVMCGYMYKKSPQKLRIRAWDQRFFVVVDMKMLWWRDRQSCALDIAGDESATIAEIERRARDVKCLPQYRGMINFALSEPKIVSMWSEKTRFRLLAPAKGWRMGATTDKRNDIGRDYEFDVEGSSHSRSEWVELLRKHIEQANLLRSGSESSWSDCEVWSEYWEDVTVDEQSLTMSRFFGRKAQANKEKRELMMQH